MSYGNHNRNRENRPISYGNGFDLQRGLNAIEGWIADGLNAEAINFTEAFGAFLADNHTTNKPNKNNMLSTSQIRIAFGEITRLKMKFNDEIMSQVLMLKPKLAYGAKRDGKVTSDHLKQIISKGIDVVSQGDNIKEKKQRFMNLANFFEATLAYHKANGGK